MGIGRVPGLSVTIVLRAAGGTDSVELGIVDGVLASCSPGRSSEFPDALVLEGPEDWLCSIAAGERPPQEWLEHVTPIGRSVWHLTAVDLALCDPGATFAETDAWDCW